MVTKTKARGEPRRWLSLVFSGVEVELEEAEVDEAERVEARAMFSIG